MLAPSYRIRLVGWSIALATVLWAAMFRPDVQQALNFWAMMPVATSLLGSLAILFGDPVFTKREVTTGNILAGIASAFVLWGLFWVGNQTMNIVAEMAPSLIHNKTGQLVSVYTQGGNVPRSVVGLLLFFPIGCGEELYWRGLVQRSIADALGPKKAMIWTVILYTAVHIPTGNLLLVLAAFTCGTFWGYMYYKYKSVVPGLISHMVWDPFIFAVVPIL
jgi:membrane protease YdiL (CAAX protease family)